MEQLASSDCTVVVVSHSPDRIELAERAIWLDHGRVCADGPLRKIVDAYIAAPAEAIGPSAS